MYKILFDTCVWLELAKDYKQQAILSALEELILQGDIELILPRTVVDEFTQNKTRILEQNSRSLSSTLKLAKEIVDKLCDPMQKKSVLSQLNDIDYRLSSLGEEAVDTISRIEKLFEITPIIEISDAVKITCCHAGYRQTCSPFIDRGMGLMMPL